VRRAHLVPVRGWLLGFEVASWGGGSLGGKRGGGLPLGELMPGQTRRATGDLTRREGL